MASLSNNPTPKTWFQKWFVDCMRSYGYSVAEIAERLHTTRATVYRHYEHEDIIPFAYVVAYDRLFGKLWRPEFIWEKIER